MIITSFAILATVTEFCQQNKFSGFGQPSPLSCISLFANSFAFDYALIKRFKGAYSIWNYCIWQCKQG